MGIPKSGDVLVVKRAFHTLAGVQYDVGDKLILMEPTMQAPWGITSRLCNWLVKCKHWQPPQPQAVWSNIWVCLEEGTLVIEE